MPGSAKGAKPYQPAATPQVSGPTKIMRAESPIPSLALFLALSPSLACPRQQDWGRAFSPALFCAPETLGVAQGWYDAAPLALGADGLEARSA
jgi:hypothetical protein